MSGGEGAGQTPCRYSVKKQGQTPPRGVTRGAQKPGSQPWKGRADLRRARAAIRMCFLGCDISELNTQSGSVGDCPCGMPRAGSCSDRLSHGYVLMGGGEMGQA